MEIMEAVSNDWPNQTLTFDFGVNLSIPGGSSVGEINIGLPVVPLATTHEIVDLF